MQNMYFVHFVQLIVHFVQNYIFLWV